MQRSASANKSRNISEEKREKLSKRITEIEQFILSAEQDENTKNLLTYIADLKEDLCAKKYGLVFEEHREQIDDILDGSIPVLTEEKKLFVNGGGEINFLIEGDNLASLRLLERTHKGKIDMIYIDPPYNTGNKDFTYGDNFVAKTDAFKHSKWLSFMSKRLTLASDLLSEEGVIFISIDDNEQSQLKLLCDEVFGEGQFVALFPWRKRSAKSDVPFGVSQDYEWILCYAKGNKFKARIKGKGRKYYETPDIPGKPWRTHEMTSQKTSTERENCYFTMVNPKTGDKYPCNPSNTWRVSKDTFQRYYDEKRIIFPGDYPFLKISGPVMRYFKDDDMRKEGEYFGYVAVSTKFPDNSKLPNCVEMSKGGTKEIKEIFNKVVFPHPKPTSLIKYLIIAATKPDSIVLDFFAGSGTTGHSVMRLNKEDGGRRKFILCTNDENNICRKVTYKRLKRIIGINSKTKPKGEIGKYEASLKYFRVEFVSLTDRLYFDYADELLGHIRELVELENAVNFENNARIAIILTEKELDKFAASFSKNTECEAIYLSHDILLTEEQKELFKNIKVNEIPDYYYKDLATS